MTEMNKINVEALENFVESQKTLNRFAPLRVEHLPLLLGFTPKTGVIKGNVIKIKNSADPILRSALSFRKQLVKIRI